MWVRVGNRLTSRSSPLPALWLPALHTSVALMVGPHRCQPSASCITHLCFTICCTSSIISVPNIWQKSLETSVVLAEEQTRFPALMRRVLCGSYLIFLQSRFGLKSESWILWALPYYIVHKGQRHCETHIVDELQFNSTPWTLKRHSPHCNVTRRTFCMTSTGCYVLALTFSGQSWLEPGRGLDLLEKSLTLLSWCCQDTSMITMWFWISKVKDAPVS